MPIIGIILGGIDFSNLAITIKDAKITYGMFIQNVINFLIIAFCIFIFIKFINKLSEIGHKNKKNESEKKVETELSILKEIRDNLNNQTKEKKKKSI